MLTTLEIGWNPQDSGIKIINFNLTLFLLTLVLLVLPYFIYINHFKNSPDSAAGITES